MYRFATIAATAYVNRVIPAKDNSAFDKSNNDPRTEHSVQVQGGLPILAIDNIDVILRQPPTGTTDISTSTKSEAYQLLVAHAADVTLVHGLPRNPSPMLTIG